MVKYNVLRVSLVMCLLLQLTSAMLMEDELTTCMQLTHQTDYCNGIYLGTFFQLDSNDDGVLSPEERSVLYETPIDTVLLPNFFPEDSEVCTYEQFCDAMVVVQFPDMSEANVNEELMGNVCEMEMAAVRETCEHEWLALFPSRVPYAGASSDAETSGVSMSKTEYRQIVLDVFNPLDGPTWSVDEFLEFINPQNDHETLLHFNRIVEAAQQGQLSVVPIDAYAEPVNNCQVAIPGERRELLLGVLALGVASVAIGSLTGATVQTAFGGGNFGHNLASHLITNTITAVGCGFGGPAACLMSGAVGGYLGGAALCGMSGDSNCWDLNNRQTDVILGTAGAIGSLVPTSGVWDDLAVAAQFGYGTGLLAGISSHEVDVFYAGGSSRNSYLSLASTCIGGYNAATYDYQSKSQCAALCDRDSNCKSFDWRSTHYRYNCAISHYRASQVRHAFSTSCSMWSYNEKTTIQRYRHIPNYAIGGMNVATYHGKTQNECAQLCNGNSRCQSFDWRPYSGYNCALNSVKCPHRQCSSSDVGGWDGNGPWDYFGKTH